MPRVLSRRELAPYEGRYEDEYIAPDGTLGKNVYELRGHQAPEEIARPYKFFYWVDPWGVQWEMEQCRPIDRGFGYPPK